MLPWASAQCDGEREDRGGGAGRVGSTLAYTLASLCVAHEIVVIDADR